MGCEGDDDVEAFRKHKLLICEADELNSDGDWCHGETNQTWEYRCFISMTELLRVNVMQ